MSLVMQCITKSGLLLPAPPVFIHPPPKF